MPGEEPEIMDTYEHTDGHDQLDEDKRSSAHPVGSTLGDDAREVGLPALSDKEGRILSGPTTAGEWARDEGASGPVDGTDSQPPESGKVLHPGESSPATDGG